ncbi:hypothetical protein ABMA28_010706 [Loxostege sticticalis]|uniref:DUF5641 domain-containing protein n=1 Tax=Loxostege sticticalis TaxID=481309 RepID=A0ABD0S945_LOXSC
MVYYEWLQQDFWRRWSRDYIGILQQRTKWRSSKGPALSVGTMVVKDDRLPPCQWKLGRIVQTHDGRDSEIKRSYVHLCPLPINID